MATSKFDTILSKIKTAKNVAVFMHINPDCDCMGSAIALTLYLRNAGKQASFFSPDLKTTDMISDKYSFLPAFKDFNVVYNDDFDLAIAVDTGDAGRIGDIAYRKFIKIKNNIVIDHHEIHEDYAQVTYRESDSASTTQILYKLMKEYDNKLIDKDIATCLYAGLVTDSGGFTYENCSPETYLIASELLKYGIHHHEICEKLLKSVKQNVFILRNKVLSETKFFENGKIGIIVFRKEDFNSTGTTEKDTDNIINYVREVDTVEIAVSLAEVGEKRYKVSFRTKSYVSAAACAKVFGGGGHVRAAGCRVQGYFEDVFNNLVDVAKEALKND